MDTAVLSATAGLVGSLIGGVSTFAASWVTQGKLLGSQRRIHDATQRQQLYSEFIVEATKRLAEAWNHQPEGPEVVTNLYSAVQRMRLISSSRVVDCAEQVMRGGHCSLCGAQQNIRRVEAARATSRRGQRPSEGIHGSLQRGITILSLHFGIVRVETFDPSRCSGWLDGESCVEGVPRSTLV
jgi:hypothetical protein